MFPTRRSKRYWQGDALRGQAESPDACSGVDGVAGVQGYFFKAGALASEWVTVADVADVVVQAQVAQSLGLRILYLFPVTVRPLPLATAQ